MTDAVLSPLTVLYLAGDMILSDAGGAKMVSPSLSFVAGDMIISADLGDAVLSPAGVIYIAGDMIIGQTYHDISTTTGEADKTLSVFTQEVRND